MVTSYDASYGAAFIAMPDGIPIDLIKSSILRPSDQLSIAELDLAKLEDAILAANGETRSLIQGFVSSLSVGATEANFDTGSEVLAYMPSATDSRQEVLRAIKLRRGQRKFRDGLIRIYGAKCMISGCELLSVLEAAHIDCYRGEEHNHTENGLLLRADLHTLFDLGLLAIDPDSLTVRVHAEAKIGTDYEKFDGYELRIKGRHLPSSTALSRRWQLFLASLA
ncbi:HNH endonuclease [Herbaspirillum chlorophenolicum]|uniref:HNH endonuclease n=1 Tax=Herbaspirillum chlorophenolicum TaxID=211589 RepID=UPI0012E17208|nr:HNH endonuclease signature motif containing protein [Herbaspirillum chlorophenolicum]